jgi:hypothetical protein
MKSICATLISVGGTWKAHACTKRACTKRTFGTRVLTSTPIRSFPMVLCGVLPNQSYWWDVIIDDTHMKIGCENHSHSAWAQFDDDTIVSMIPGRSYRTIHDMLLTLCEVHTHDANLPDHHGGDGDPAVCADSATATDDPVVRDQTCGRD